MKLSATSIFVALATLSGALAQTPESPPSKDQPVKAGTRYYATKCENISPYGEGWHLRCDFDEKNQKISEEEAKASAAQWKVLVTKL
ncbi:hypothetical protein H634G_08616 [Metarhizium anisopliae BRIP 53293]|uniref:Uncharacterized protein n=1 Tax=Metarhizium anisopliae BRIP 53293 TaxID=1291518 RepID=A0A0D9NUA4_METAN|nr:hypothetical protein H634G_08616 [Metarhizium anisopliae BRIP 53293]KJK91548.1 hypothetical protein H633G_04604 [Metarhizium anisopliae BRIP 53284]